ncbi:YggS family pyridoxal phosphate-dependent enzyme [Jatrophihabitans sp.]|uniref:YggS family pyridoxal phosphate-dependent enzyme n=1 Tax=Jatrophihabitans sp. TaxID=1932789 RepID=UPI002C70B4D4|nr:YggS family pyridoxal phosphate-dependent enzyme [Jatrophihabitans sp.]
MTAPSSPTDRLAELRANLAAVRSRIEAGCQAAGRSSAEITLIAVTKFFPVTDVALLAELGVTDVGESRDQDASVKAAELAEHTSIAVRWHFIGRLQTNKARSVARYADLVHSVDRPGLADALADGARRAERSALDVLVQLNLDESAEDVPTGRGGGTADDLLRLADQVAASDVLRLAGIMAIAPLGGDADRAFDRLAEVAQRLRADHPQAAVVSAGMSEDLEAALRHGATHVRIGTALLGRREPQFG